MTISTPTSKRSRQEVEQNITPSKSTSKIKTPSKSTARAKGDSTPRAIRGPETPRSERTKLNGAYTTPQKPTGSHGKNVHIVRSIDRSARRRTARNLIDQTLAGESSDQEDLQAQSLAQEIFDEDGIEAESDREEGEQNLEIEDPATPSKKGKIQVKSRRKRSPTPPTDLAPHERYFYDNRASAAKTSMSTLNSADLISHSAYHEAISNETDSHALNIDDLHEHHASSFPLWAFELSQQFSLCLYGYGSKRRILKSFATYLHQQSSRDPPTTIMINGLHPDVSIKSVLVTIANAILSTRQTKLPTQPQQLVSLILLDLADHPRTAPIYLLISVFHTRALATPQSLSILAQLSTHPSIHLVFTADNPSFPLFFPTKLRATFNFLFHNTTTFLPYDTGTADSELSTVVDSVLELIGRKTSSAGGREGVRWVLKSLPENARGLYRILVSEILSAAAEGSAPAFDIPIEQPLGEDMDIGATPSKSRSKREQPSSHALPGIDAKVLYQKAVEEFLCSSEMMFWSLLKEFVDHRMVIVRKERGLAGGGEMLGVDIGKEELEGVLEDLLE